MEKPRQQPRQPETVRCGVCRKEIPRSEARSAEAHEYVFYFCGLDCYERWRADRLASQMRTSRRGAA